MRSFGRLLALLLVVACPLIAKADGIDFNMNVQDPPEGPFPQFSSNSFSFQFYDCPTDANGVSEGDGCFTAENVSGQTWTTLQFTIQDSPYFQNNPQAAGCTVSTIYSSCSTPNGGEPVDGAYTVVFSGGTGILDFQYFTIIEDGVPDTDFPMVGAVANAPEPSSLLLVGTGLLGLAWLGSKRYAGRVRS